MSRYIDADKALEDADTIDPKYKTLIEQVKRIINAQPSADVVEVVRCKDCIEYEHSVPYCGNCSMTGSIVRGDEFCSYGERKDGDNDE